MRLSFRKMDPRFLELELRLYLCRDDLDPVEFLIISDCELLVKHGTRWITVSVADMITSLCAVEN